MSFSSTFTTKCLKNDANHEVFRALWHSDTCCQIFAEVFFVQAGTSPSSSLLSLHSLVNPRKALHDTSVTHLFTSPVQFPSSAAGLSRIFFQTLCVHRAKHCFFLLSKSDISSRVASTYFLQNKCSNHTSPKGSFSSPPLCLPSACSSLKALAPPFPPRKSLQLRADILYSPCSILRRNNQGSGKSKYLCTASFSRHVGP